MIQKILIGLFLVTFAAVHQYVVVPYQKENWYEYLEFERLNEKYRPVLWHGTYLKTEYWF